MVEKSTLEKRIITFISFDIVDSTPLKYLPELNASVYAKDLYDLYALIEEAALELEIFWDFWKFNGDEFIYKIELKYQDVLYNTISAVDKALEIILKSSVRFPVKAAVWTALIDDKSARNKTVFFKGKDKTEIIQEDFVGRDIDIGFRISKYSEFNKSVLCLNTVRLLYESFSKEVSKNIKLMSFQNIKGLFNLEKYPIFCFINNEGSDVDWHQSYFNKYHSKYKEHMKDYIDMDIDQVIDFYKHRFFYLTDNNLLNYFKSLKKKNS